MKTLFIIIRAVVALAAAPLLAAAPASLIRFTPVSGWPNADWPISKPGSSLALAGNYAYVGGDDGDVRISDVTDPTNPVAMSTLTLTNNQRPSEIVVSGQHLYVRYYAWTSNDTGWPAGGFHVFDVSDPANPVPAGNYDPGHGLSALEVSGSNAFAAFYNTKVSPTETGVRVLDVSNPAQPVLLSVYTNAGGANGMAVLSNRLYLANETGLKIIDVSNPRNPALLGSFQTFEGAYDVAVAGNCAYVATGREGELTADAGLELIDVSNLSQPQRAGIYRTGAAAARVTLHGRFAYVITDIDPAWRVQSVPGGRFLQVFDAGDPANLKKVDQSNLSFSDYYNPSISDVGVANGHLFLPDQTRTIILNGQGLLPSIYRIDEMPAIGPTLGLRTDQFAGRILSVQSPGFDDFTLMTATSVTNWQTYGSVFSRMENYSLSGYIDMPDEPARFYRAAGEVLTPAAMASRWKAIGITNYQFTFARGACFCIPRQLSGLVTVQNGLVTRVQTIQGEEIPATGPIFPQFMSIDQLFEFLQKSAAAADLMVIKWDHERHFPTDVQFNSNVELDHGRGSYSITGLIVLE